MRAVFSTTRFILTSFVLSLVLLACAAFAVPTSASASADACRHEFRVQDCTQERYCSKCEQYVTTNTEHAWGEWQTGDSRSHARNCTNYDCIAVDVGYHRGGTATCTDPAACAVCGGSYGEVDQDNHDWGEWEHDGAGRHVRHCNRDSRNHFEAEDHSGGAPTCTEAASCTVCGGPYLDALNHADYGVTEWRYMSERSHYRLCLGCNTNESVAAHSGGAATCTDPATCAVCGGSYGEVDPDNHDWGEWEHDDAAHWRECSCGEKKDAAAHSGGTATCTERARCSACAAEYGELAAHAFESGKCAACGAADPSRSPEAAIAQAGDSSNAPFWATLLLASGATIALAVAGGKRRIAADSR